MSGIFPTLNGSRQAISVQQPVMQSCGSKGRPLIGAETKNSHLLEERGDLSIKPLCFGAKWMQTAMRSNPMRIAALCFVALVTFGSAAHAQQTTGNAAPSVHDPAPGPAQPQPGDPFYPDSSTGRDQVAKDGISTKVVKAAPCSAAAQETDGSTTCIGIPDRR
jgi:hypothetical protein